MSALTEEASQGNERKTQRILLLCLERKWKWKLFTLVPETQGDGACQRLFWHHGIQPRWCGKEQWAVLHCKWIIQQPHRIPALLSRPPSEGRAEGDSWRLGLSFFIDFITHGEQVTAQSESVVRVGERVCTRVTRSVMFKWECNMICLPVLLFFSCNRTSSSHCMSEGADSFHFPELNP